MVGLPDEWIAVFFPIIHEDIYPTIQLIPYPRRLFENFHQT